MSSREIIGIDLGTSNSRVAVMQGGHPVVLANRHGSRAMSSVAALTDDGWVFGEEARRQAVVNPANTLFSVKRLLGREWGELSPADRVLPYRLIGGEGLSVKVEVSGTALTPQAICAMLFGELKKTAEDHLGESVEAAVVSVPAYYNDAQRTAIKEAAELAGLEVKRLLNEATAGALAYLHRTGGADKTIGVFHLGGGTFDVSIVELYEEEDADTRRMIMNARVLSTSGDARLGGDDVDAALWNHVADKFMKETAVDLRKDPVALQRLREAAELAKCGLSSCSEARINLPFIWAGKEGPKHVEEALTRQDFERLCGPLFDRLAAPCRQAMEDARKALWRTPLRVSDVLLIGGSTRIPKVQEIARDIFGMEPNLSLNPDEAAALGCAVLGAIVGPGRKAEALLIDVTPFSLGVETLGGVMTPIIERNQALPCLRHEVFSTAADNQTCVRIRVLMGERAFAADNRTLGRFELGGIPPGPRGLPQIQVAFDMDVNGILNVSAKDLATGAKRSVTID